MFLFREWRAGKITLTKKIIKNIDIDPQGVHNELAKEKYIWIVNVVMKVRIVQKQKKILRNKIKNYRRSSKRRC